MPKQMKIDVTELRNFDDATIELPQDVQNGEGWILVFPRGRHYFQKYDEWVSFDDKFFEEIADGFDSKTLGRPFVDKEHELAESYGEILDYRWDSRGMEFKVRLNDVGKLLVSSRQFKYISPAFGRMKDIEGKEHKMVLYAISLVNFPALMGAVEDLQTQLQLKNGQIKKKTEVKKMAKLKLDANKLTSLKGFVDEGKIKNLVNHSVVKLQATEEGIDVAEVQDVLAGLVEMLDEMKARIETVTAEKKAAEDAATKINEEVAEMKAKALKEEAEVVILQAIKDGQYQPVLKELKVSQYVENKETIEKELSLLPKIKDGQKTKVSNSGIVTLSAEDREIAKAAGYDLSDEKELKAYISVMGIEGGE